MAGSIFFTSGLAWGVSSIFYREALVAIAEVGADDDGCIKALRDATELSWLALGDVPEPTRGRLLSAMQSEAFRSRFAENASRDTFREMPSALELINDLVAMARREHEFPEWHRLDSAEGIVVKGLPLKAIEQLTGADPWPIRTTIADSVLRHEFFQSPIVIEVELAPGSVERADGAVTVDLNGTAVVVSGDGVAAATLDRLAEMIAHAHAALATS